MAGNLNGSGPKYRRRRNAIANGDLSRKITVDVRGEILELKETIKHDGRPAQRLRRRSDRVAREAGSEGKLGGQADVKDVSGVWKDLTDNVNSNGKQSDGPGPKHRRGGDRYRAR